MPVKLFLALVLLALATTMQVAHIAEGNTEIPTLVNLALKLFLVAGLVRGSEVARTLALVVAFLNLLAGLLGVFFVGAAFSMLSLWLQLQLVVPFVFGGYLLWCMNQDDVKAWLFRRAHGDVGDA